MLFTVKSNTANNRCEQSHEHTPEQERQMQGFKSPRHARRFLSLHARMLNAFQLVQCDELSVVAHSCVRYVATGDLRLE